MSTERETVERKITKDKKVLLHRRRNVFIMDNCGPLAVHMDSSTSAGLLASCCARIGGVVSEGSVQMNREGHWAAAKRRDLERQ